MRRAEHLSQLTFREMHLQTNNYSPNVGGLISGPTDKSGLMWLFLWKSRRHDPSHPGQANFDTERARELGGPGGDLCSPPDANSTPRCLCCPSQGLSCPCLISSCLLPPWTRLTNSSLFRQMFLFVSDLGSRGNLGFFFTKWRLYFSLCKILGPPNT